MAVHKSANDLTEENYGRRGALEVGVIGGTANGGTHGPERDRAGTRRKHLVESIEPAQACEWS